MNRMKLFVAAFGFAAAAGTLTAGNIYVGSSQVGDYTGNVTVTGTGDIRFPSGTNLGSSGGTTSGPSCGLNAHVNSAGTGCVCDTGYDYSGGSSVPENTDCTLTDTGGGTTTGGSFDCSGVGHAGSGGDPQSYSGFPTVGVGNVKKISAQQNHYTSVKFTMPTSAFAGSLYIIGSTTYPSPQTTVAISKCPGDFGEALADTTNVCRWQGAIISSMFFTNQAGYGVCTLQAGKTYYVNYFNGIGTSNNLSNTCDASRCGHDFTYRDVSDLL